VVRRAGKKFVQRVPDPSRAGEWIWKLGTTKRVLYRLPKVAQGVRDGELIYVCEGEKDVAALENAGVIATCNSGGAGKWQPEFAEVLRDAMVRIVADKDEPGQAHAREVAASLEGVAATIEIVEALTGKDAADHLGAGHALADFEITFESVPDAPADLAPDLYEFLSVVDPPNSWIIPGLLERGDRLIWTGFEGLGKTQFIRTIAVCAAAGIHPFTGQTFEPQRVLFIDCENPDKNSRFLFRKLERVARYKRRPVVDKYLRILMHPSGVDLTRPEGAAWLLERVTAHKPDLLVVGPLYKLHASDANEESAARKIVTVLDAARVKGNCALITEHHAGHGDFKDRSVRPTGSSLLLRWPEFGYGIKPLGEADAEGHHRWVTVCAWRGPRMARKWPTELQWGDPKADWPWIPTKPMPYFEETEEGD
jgi:5S rRNA maturation endonuclease (ribonuclease M5)